VGQEGQEGVLLTGMFGTGKSTILEEIAVILEERGAPFAAIDLDWLSWFNVPGGPSEHEMLLRNLAAVVGTYVAEGVRWFVFARALRHRSDLDSLRAALRFPLRVVGLTVPPSETERRLGADPTTGRARDLREAGGSQAEGLEDLVVPNEGPVRGVAEDILDRLGWTARLRA
jgi:hypothetical protein